MGVQLLVLLSLCSLSLFTSTTRAGFVLTLTVHSLSTRGNCLGDDIDADCETFLSVFCLRGPRQSSSTVTTDCPLGVNNQQIGPDQNIGTREITSTAPWQGGFQMFIQALDDDANVSHPDHLDDIFVNLLLEANSGSSGVNTYSGSRVSVDMSFSVQCLSSFFGSDCQTFCTPQDDDVNGHFVCDPDGSRVCLPNFYDPQCLTLCVPSADEVNGFYTCDPDNGSRICSEGFTDPENLCRENIDDCTQNPCQNGGHCRDLVSDFLCECVPGYTGEACSIDIDECVDVECPGNSTCVDAVNAFICVCNPGFECTDPPATITSDQTTTTTTATRTRGSSGVMSGIVAGSVVLVLILIVLIMAFLSILLVRRTKAKKTSVSLEQTDLKVYAYNVDCCSESAHLPSPSQPGATLTQNPAYIKTPDIPVQTNESYGGTTTTSPDSNELYATPRGDTSTVPQAMLTPNTAYNVIRTNGDVISVDCNMAYGTSTHLPSPPQPATSLTQNPAYITTPDIPVKRNESYGGIATSSLNSNATPRGKEHTTQQFSKEDYDYVT